MMSTQHCEQDKKWNAVIHNYRLISGGISNVVLSTESLTVLCLIFVTYLNSAENTEVVS